MYKGYKRLKFKREGAILTITLSNPASRNSVDRDMHAELARVWLEVAVDSETRVVVLTGDPKGKAFCAGGDINWIQTMSGDGGFFSEVLQEGLDVVKNLVAVPQPVIALINGHAMGLGATVALYTDVQFMNEDAKIGDPHVAIGVVAGDGGAGIWPLLMGPNRAKEYLMTGDAITGKVAEELNLVNHALPAAEAKAAAYAFAKRLAEGPQYAIELTKRSVNMIISEVVGNVVTASLAMEGLTFNTPDHLEAVKAFIGKRKPVYGKKK